MKEQFASYEVAKLMKQLGFNEPCFSYFGDGRFGEFAQHVGSIFTYSEDVFDEDELKEGLIVLAPLYQQALDFLSLKGYAMAYKSNKVSLDKDLLCMLEYLLKKEQTEG